jgi:nitroimidazol reductase NimA-like FMN-containing flavoprotein (pyridoxamine 5'-phosphate oxidase superfamily)
MTDEQYEEAVSFWEKKDAASKQMDKAELFENIDRFLSDHKVLALASGGSDFIRCTPLEYTWHDGALWIFTEGGLKFRALKANNKVSATVFEQNTGFGSLKSAQIQGTAEIVDLFSEGYNAEAAFRKIPIEALKKLPEPMWLIKIVPDEITFLNSEFKEAGYGSRQTWDLLS